MILKYNLKSVLSVLLLTQSSLNRHTILRASGGLMEGDRAGLGHNHYIYCILYIKSWNKIIYSLTKCTVECYICTIIKCTVVITAMNIPCTWSSGSVRFFSAGIYFNTTVSSPLYCIVVSILLSSCKENIHNPLKHCHCDDKEKKRQTKCEHDGSLIPTFGCRAYHSSIWESNSQESNVSSTSPRKLLCPNRSWCHTETWRVRVSSCEWLITYYTRNKKCHKRNNKDFNSKLLMELELWSLGCASTDPQILVENRVIGVGFDARLPLALSWHVREQVSLHITAMKQTQWLNRAPLEAINICPCSTTTY